MTRLRDRCPKGRRPLAKAPFTHWRRVESRDSMRQGKVTMSFFALSSSELYVNSVARNLGPRVPRRKLPESVAAF
jgi:hypothetical protein